jgi:hypothetical protein
VRDFERRERFAQRDAVDRALPDSGDIWLLRTLSGEVVVYEEKPDKRRPAGVRAIVSPDGRTQSFETGRFRRRR